MIQEVAEDGEESRPATGQDSADKRSDSKRGTHIVRQARDPSFSPAPSKETPGPGAAHADAADTRVGSKISEAGPPGAKDLASPPFPMQTPAPTDGRPASEARYADAADTRADTRGSEAGPP